MKITIIFILQLLLINTIIAQNLSYTFTGKDKAKTRLKCNQKMMIRLVVTDAKVENVEYKIANKSGEIIKLNNYIFNVIANGEKDSVQIGAYNKVNKSKLGVVSVFVHCPEDIQVVFYGKFDDDTIYRGRITKPIDFQVIDVNDPKASFDVVEYNLSYVQDKVVYEYHFRSSKKSLYVDQFIDEIKKKKVEKIFIGGVIVNRTSEPKVVNSNFHVPGAILILK